MRYNHNKIFTAIYFFLMVTPIPFLSVSAYSYYWVQNTFGHIPDNEKLYKLLREYKGVVQIVSFKTGEIFLLAFLSSLALLPLFILFNYLVNKKSLTIHFNKKYAILVTGVYILAFMLATRTNPFGNWYLQLMVD
jgi:hypothetical protein